MKFDLSRKVKDELKKEGVVLAYLYGSCARGEEVRESDIDIAILFDKKINKDSYLKKYLKLSSILSEFYKHEREIGLMILNQASPLLKQNTVVDGQELYEKDEWTKIAFENRTLHEYEDSLHLQNIYHKYLNQRIKNL